MDQTVLDDAQAASLSLEKTAIEACPGAGKTRTAVARFRARSDASAQGVGLLSFTNAAVDEAGRRLVDTPEKLRPPNFLGTVDEFLRRFVVSPIHAKKDGSYPRYVNSWDDLLSDVRWIRVAKVKGSGIGLGHFQMDSIGRIKMATQLPDMERQYLASAEAAGHSVESLTEIAGQRIKGLYRSGIMSCDLIRAMSLWYLRQGSHAAHLERLHSRFGELIIDEFQDCSTVEHELFKLLLRAGINIVPIADPDQAIYEFRQTAPSSYNEYLVSTEMPIHPLSVNYRSTPAICRLIRSLQSSGRNPVTSGLDPARVPEQDEIRLLTGTVAAQRGRFVEVCDELGVPPEERIVLAHRRTVAARLASNPSDSVFAPGGTNSQRVLKLIGVARHSQSPEQIHRALGLLERIYLDWYQYPQSVAMTREARLDALEIEGSHLRLITRALIQASRAWTSSSDALDSIRGILRTMLSTEVLPLQSSPGQRFRNLDTSDWKAWTAIEERQQGSGLAGLHVHAAKGREWEAVLLDVGQSSSTEDSAVDAWIEGRDTESRRVLYVGASRAQRLLALAVGRAELSRLQGYLDDQCVSYVVEDA